MTGDEIDRLMQDAEAAGFGDVRRESRVLGRRIFNVVLAYRKPTE